MQQPRAAVTPVGREIIYKITQQLLFLITFINYSVARYYDLAVCFTHLPDEVHSTGKYPIGASFKNRKIFQFNDNFSGDGQEGRLEEEEGRVHRRLEGRQGGAEAHRGRGQDLGSSATATDGHVGLHPLSALRKEVQRVRSGSPHPEVQGHQEQQAIDVRTSGQCLSYTGSREYYFVRVLSHGALLSLT